MDSTARSLVAECFGTALLLFVIVGSGINAIDYGGSGTVALLAHAVAVGAGLAALIAMLAPVSGAHFNPSVTIGFWLTDVVRISLAGAFIVAQLAGAIIGVVVANLTFGLDAIAVSSTERASLGPMVAEFIATLVLVLLILGLVRTGRTAAVAPAVGAWVAAIMLATVSTGFANPAVTFARIATETFTGIAAIDAFAFILAQLLAAAAAAWLAFALFPAQAVAAESEARHD